jgi:hypothetical protein
MVLLQLTLPGAVAIMYVFIHRMRLISTAAHSIAES